MRILVVDDELSMREYLDLLLSQAGYEVTCAAGVRDATELIKNHEFDVVISDMKLGNDSGLSVLDAARGRSSAPEVILITAYGTPASAVEAMRRGAYDYICKPFDNEELKLLVQKALEKRGLVRENSELRRKLDSRPGSAWIGNSQAMKQIWQLVQKVAPTRSTVLVTGESGTGKEVVARAIHWQGTRSGQSFVPVNCAAIAEGVLESELFGHVRGAFTGATQDRPGILVSAGQGTVFLDEIGEIPASTQVKLLRVLQEKRVRPVGSTEEKSFEARVLAATNKNLEAEVRAGRFREDLFYRLNVITIELPPLRERKEDIPQLAHHFLDRMAIELGRPGLRFTDEARTLLQRYPFPGNVRQLQNMVERAATLSDMDVLGPETLPPAISGYAEPPISGPVEFPAQFSLERHLDQLERQYLLEALKRADGVKTRAAELLNLSFRSFRYRLAKHGLSDIEDSGRTV